MAAGQLPSTNQDHGIYISGYYAMITNNYIYDNADRGVQLRGSQNGTIQHNVIDRNGEGVIFGDQVTSNNDVSNNIVSNSNIRWNAESFWGSGPVGTGNSFHNNCVWASNSESYYDSQGGVDGPDGFSTSANTIGNPLYVNAGAGNYAIPSGSPCAGKGPLTTAIGVSTSPPPPPPPATTAATTTAAATTTPPSAGTTTSPAPTTTTSAGTTTTPSFLRVPGSSSPPIVSALPSVHGTPVVGSLLAATPGTWTSAGSNAYSWLRCQPSGAACVPIGNATSSAYRLTSDDRGSRIRVTVIAQNANGSTSATSAATSTVRAR